MTAFTPQKLSLLAPAKLNLFLHILGRREDGYHELQTLFQLLSYGDTLTFETRTDQQLALNDNIPGVETADNLIFRAAKHLQSVTGCQYGANIAIEKRLPMGGGLGGGSSDAATTLVALNHLWQTDLSTDDLCIIGVSLGADVPVFIRGRTAWAEGIGEKLQPLDMPEHWFLVVKPDCHVATSNIFSHQQLTRDTLAITVAALFEQGGINDCEKVVCQLYPEIAEALKWLQQYSPAQMTGTGACIFAAFSSEGAALTVLEEIPQKWEGFIAKGINHSPLLSFSVNKE